MRVGISTFLSIAILGCGGQPAGSPTAAPAPKAAAALEHDAGASPPPATSAVVAAEVDASAPDAAPAAPPPPPAPVERTGKTWPFHAWTRAEAVLFNQFPMRYPAQLRAYDENGWSADVAERKPLDDGMAKKAVEIVKAHEGDVAVSKCPFPRHAVVLFDGDVPVASINVCFTCGDIMLWPRWAPAPDWEKMTDAQRKTHWAREEKHLKRYEGVFPRWKTYFRDEIGWPIDTFSH